MREETFLTWNATNWVTVLLMVAIGFAVLRLGATLYGRYTSNS
jgi:hypothetical protein